MSAPAPAVSVVLATHNRASRLAALLTALRLQDFAEAFEVIVVDDGSHDETSAVLAAERARGDLDLRVAVHVAAKGPSAARNTGWRSARAGLIVFTDDDCEPTPRWLSGLWSASGRDPMRIVQGRVVPNPSESSTAGPFTRSLRVEDVGPYFQTANIAYPKALLEQVDGFDERVFPGPSAEDADLGHRCLNAGAHQIFAEDAVTHHAVHQLGPLGKLRVAARWTDTVAVYRRHPDGMRGTLTYRVFWKKTHYLLVRAAIGLILPRRLRALRFWCVTPIAPAYWERTALEGHGARWTFPYFILHDVIEMVAILRGAIRYRTPLI